MSHRDIDEQARLRHQIAEFDARISDVTKARVVDVRLLSELKRERQKTVLRLSILVDRA